MLMDDEAKANALNISGDLVEEIAYWKGAFYQYITECDRDPALLKVAHTVGHIQLREIANSFASLGGGEIAEWLLSDRENLTPVRVLSRLQKVDLLACRGHQALGGQLPSFEAPDSFPTLAEHRARLLIACARDESGNPVFSDGDLRRLANDPSPVPDRLYTAAARLNKMPLPTMDQPEAPPLASDKDDANELPQWLIDLSGKPGKLVRCLWNRRTRAASFDELHAEVWDDPVTDDTLKKTITRANQHIIEHGHTVSMKDRRVKLESVRQEPSS